jgi:cytochrome c oxidase cbb3-type subunit 4
MISGIVTAILLASFLGITAWAWSSRQHARFDDASKLPLRDEPRDTALRADSGRTDEAEDRP